MSPPRKPRPIEFMTRGIDLADALAILDRWETMTAKQIMDLGFDPTAFSGAEPSPPESPSVPEQMKPKYSCRPRLVDLRVIQGGIQSDQDSERCTPEREPS